MDRRRFLTTGGAALAATALAPGRWRASGGSGGAAVAAASGRASGDALATASGPFDPADWASVRASFPVADDEIDLSALYVSSHPDPVRDAIENHRRELDRRPTRYLKENDRRLTARAIAAAARYMGADPADVALVDSTTMGLGILYGGLDLRPGDEVLTTAHDYYATHESLRLAAERTGATVRKIRLYEDVAAWVVADELADRIAGAIRPETRVVALTWVHSGTGLKLPLAEIAERVRRLDARRPAADRVLLCVDGVHGFGVEDAGVEDLGFDFFVAGCHKWLFGPRGTGVVWGRGESWGRVRPTIPSFLADDPWLAWVEDRAPRGPTNALGATPGGFKPFEHRWALAEAFEFHRAIGRARVAARTHALARRLKEGLAEMGHVRVVTPMDAALSAGIVCFDLAGTSPWEAVRRLSERGIVATVTPYAVRHVRLSPSIRNDEAEVDAALAAVRALAPPRPAAPLSVDGR